MDDIPVSFGQCEGATELLLGVVLLVGVDLGFGFGGSLGLSELLGLDHRELLGLQHLEHLEELRGLGRLDRRCLLGDQSLLEIGGLGLLRARDSSGPGVGDGRVRRGVLLSHCGSLQIVGVRGREGWCEDYPPPKTARAARPNTRSSAATNRAITVTNAMTTHV
ncbi:unannotated protein [freshwater metagenome]|uniref:Unannotated protein n=1 Tax=freshwater metagenome TaxID=449393 RepID=A0A6J7QYF6_9ZZZZ